MTSHLENGVKEQLVGRLKIFVEYEDPVEQLARRRGSRTGSPHCRQQSGFAAAPMEALYQEEEHLAKKRKILATQSPTSVRQVITLETVHHHLLKSPKNS